jgi:hypothetical protein
MAFLKEKKQIAVLCFLTDVALSVWSYYEVTNYDEFSKTMKTMVASPDLQLQIYQLLLQALTFTLLLFILFHFVIYILFWKDKKYAVKYVRMYTFMAALSCLIMIFSKMYVGIIPFFIYGLSFNQVSKMTKALAEMQTPPLSTKPQLKNK